MNVGNWIHICWKGNWFMSALLVNGGIWKKLLCQKFPIARRKDLYCLQFLRKIMRKIQDQFVDEWHLVVLSKWVLRNF